jgi:general secretion pathway protein H
MLRGRKRDGISLIEVLVVLAIVGLLGGVVVYSIRSIAKTDLRTSAAKLAGAIRYCFDRSMTSGAYFRLVLDLDKNKYWVEKSDERMYLQRDKEKVDKKGKAYDRDEKEKKEAEEDKLDEERFAGKNPLAAALEPPPKPKKAHFEAFKDANLPEVSLPRKVALFDVYTPRQEEPYRAGRAYLYFFPDGHTERALVRLQSGDDWYSLVVHPLNGRVEVKSGKYELPRDFDDPREPG